LFILSGQQQMPNLKTKTAKIDWAQMKRKVGTIVPKPTNVKHRLSGPESKPPFPLVMSESNQLLSQCDFVLYVFAHSNKKRAQTHRLFDVPSALISAKFLARLCRQAPPYVYSIGVIIA